MSRIFISHSSANNAEAIAIKEWMASHGWDDVFLDFHSERGIKGGERWQDALKRAAERCELVVFLVSPEWARSTWCVAEFQMARSFNKRILPAIIAPTPLADLPVEMSAEWQVIDLIAGVRNHTTTVTLPADRNKPGVVPTAEVALSSEGLNRLRIGLIEARLDAKYFAWPPQSDPNRPPYRGLRPLESEDAGIFFGRDGPIVETLDRLRGLRDAAPPRLLVILGASGGGKSSFLRAGLLPRLARDDRHFLPLPIVRSERAALSGETGFVAALTEALSRNGHVLPRASVQESVAGGAVTIRPMLAALVESAAAKRPSALGVAQPKPPTLVLPIDQGEELFLAEGAAEAQALLVLLRDLITEDAPALMAVVTIRSDNYERLQMAKPLEGLRQSTLSLPPMPQGNYAEVIRGPARRLDGTQRKLVIEDRLTERLLADIEAGGAKDALPLLAFTLERLYLEYGGDGDLKLGDYAALGGITGAIEAAIERAFKAADGNSRIPKDRQARLALLRRGLIPWLAGIDPDTKAPRRRVARLSEIPAEARPLIDLLVEQRLLSTDVAKDTRERTIEPAHEALLRQWGLLQGWLAGDAGQLVVLDGIKRAARDWAANGKVSEWLVHDGERLRAAERLLARHDLAVNLELTDKAYVSSCQQQERAERWRARRGKLVIGGLATSVVAVAALAYFKILDPTYLEGVYNGYWNRLADVSLKPGDVRRDCASEACPEMVVIPPGEFMMGSPTSEKDRNDDEGPQRKVTIASPFLVSKYEVTFAEWDACLVAGGCSYRPSDADGGRDKQPTINVSWNDVQQYISWLSIKTGMVYRLLSEAEWEFAARAGTTTTYSWGGEAGLKNAHCSDCGSEWDKKKPAPVGSFKPNGFGLYDMHGNVWEWVQDCYLESYAKVATDGSKSPDTDGCHRVVRGGSFHGYRGDLRSASRGSTSPGNRSLINGFRVARDLSGLAHN